MIEQRGANAGFRLWIIALGIAIFFWLSKEDSGVVAVTALGSFLAGAVAWRLIFLQPHCQMIATGKLSAGRGVLGGICFGAFSSFFTALLMLLKDLLHSHVFPDYPPELIMGALERLPAWSLAGGLIGLGLSLLFGLGAGSQGR